MDLDDSCGNEIRFSLVPPAPAGFWRKTAAISKLCPIYGQAIAVRQMRRTSLIIWCRNNDTRRNVANLRPWGVGHQWLGRRKGNDQSHRQRYDDESRQPCLGIKSFHALLLILSMAAHYRRGTSTHRDLQAVPLGPGNRRAPDAPQELDYLVPE